MLSSTVEALFVVDLDSPPGLGLAVNGEVIIGAPMTPVSHAGVAH
jgi:hypothetical protein